MALALHGTDKDYTMPGWRGAQPVLSISGTLMRVSPAQVAAVLYISRQMHPLPGAVLLGRSQPCPAQLTSAFLTHIYPGKQNLHPHRHTDTLVVFVHDTRFCLLLRLPYNFSSLKSGPFI